MTIPQASPRDQGSGATYEGSMLPAWEACLIRLDPISYEAEALAERIAHERSKLGLGPFVRIPPPPPGPPRPLVKSGLRADVWDKTGGKCWYCGRQTNPWRDFSIDHFLPSCNGGSDDLTNLVPCCRSCNNRKQGRPAQRLRELLADDAGPGFNAEQLAYLRAQGVTLPTYQFYYERLELAVPHG
jgi:hypothetical protein